MFKKPPYRNTLIPGLIFSTGIFILSGFYSLAWGQTYCTSSGTTAYQTGITLVSFNTINNISAKPAGYTDYTSLTTDIIKGNSYNLTVNLNTDGNYWIYARAWIDWNRDGDFDDAGESFDMGRVRNTVNGPTNSSPLSITVPAGATTGTTRMRVSAKYNGYPTSCETGFDGEVEDYSLNILAASTLFYSRGSDPTVLSNWNTVRTGGGSTPANFSASNQSFIVQVSSPMTAVTPWSISGTNTRVQVESGSTLTANAAISISASTTFQLDNGARYNHMVASNTVWGGTEIINAGSTVVYGRAGAQDIAALTYGSLTFSGGGDKTMLGNVTVSGIMTMTLGNIITGANTLTLSNAAPGGLSRTSGTIIGRFQRATGTTGADYIFPVGTSSYYRPAVINFSSLSAATDITAEFIATPPSGFTPYDDGAVTLINPLTEGFWRFSSTGLPSATYSLRLTGAGFVSYTINEGTRITGRDNGNTTWRALGTHGSWSGSDVSRNAITNLNTTSFDFALAAGCLISSMGYGYERNIIIDYTKVAGGSDLYNFPVMINLSGQNFLQSAPAGQILNPNGFDIIFTDGNYNKLDHQLEYYNGTNGDLIAWVRIAVLSSTSNTAIKILYGNPHPVTDPSVTTVWDSHYKGVWHLDDNGLRDFTSHNVSGTPYNSPTYSAGRINNALELNGSTQYVGILNDPNTNITGNITVSAWVYMDTGGRDQKIAGNQNNSSGGYKFGIYTNNKVEFEIRNAANTPSLNRDVAGGTVLGTGQWYYLAGISSDVLDSIKTFVNGIPERPFKKTGTLGVASDNLIVGREPFVSSYFFDGRFDELRISDEVRSDGWMRTEYNNQFSPSTFYAVDAVGTLMDYLPSEGFCEGSINLTFGYPSGGVYSGNPYISGTLFTPPAAGTYSIIYTYDGGCGPSSIAKSFIITDTPLAPAASNKEYCTSQIAYLEATTGENIRWYEAGVLVSTANPFSTGKTAAGTYNYTVTQTVNGCESPARAVSLTIYSSISITAQPQPATTCAGSNASFSLTATGYNLAYRWQENGINITDGGIYSGATTPILTLTNPGTALSGRQYRCVITATCGASPVTSSAALLTVNATPVATFSYAGTPYCINASNPLPTFSGGGIAGTFSSTAGLVFVSTATGQVNIGASTPGSYTVTNTIAPAGFCGQVTATSPITISPDLIWSGALNSDWNSSGNWSCGLLPTQTSSVRIPNVPNKPVLAGGAAGAVNNLTIEAGSSLTVAGNTLRIAGAITNSGTFTATGGTVEMNGTAAQTLGAGLFNGNVVQALVINNMAGVTLLGPLGISRSVKITNGNMASGGHLTLLSTAAQTAFIDGTGAGNISGNVTMQRYLASGFGYKYISSPFQGATVNELGDEVNLASAFPPVYRYVESRTASGWAGYSTAANILNPIEGYAVNFGSVATPVTVDITGVVNNGPVSVTLYNNNNTYTKGFNLVGNPYPSAIDWDAAGWTKTSIDNAVYYFRASTTDEYGGTYSSYINGISTDPGVATNIIPSMQGFFVHVTNGTFPVTGTLGAVNSVRVNDLSHPILKSAKIQDLFLIRATASFTDDATSTDPVVIYFKDGPLPEFDSGFDALKLMNTNVMVTNFYSLLTGGTKLSINALPAQADTALYVPLGLKTYRDGEINFTVKDIENQPEGVRVYFRDKGTGANVKMLPGQGYKITLTAGDYNDRFYLAFLKSITGTGDAGTSSGLFSAYVSEGSIRATVGALSGKEGIITLYDLTGRPLLIKKVYEPGDYELAPGVKQGIYILGFETGNYNSSIKLVLGFR